jgi:hypothetical protein
MRLEARLQRLETRRPPAMGIEELKAWVQELGRDDLRCLVALGEPEAERRPTLSDSMTLDQARARALALLEQAPAAVRLAFVEDAECED